MTGTFTNNNGRTILLVAAACAACILIVIVVLAVAGRSNVSIKDFEALQQRLLALEAKTEKHSITLEGLEQVARQNDVFQQFVNEAAKRESEFMFRISDIEAKLGIAPPVPAESKEGQESSSPSPQPPVASEPKTVTTAPAPAPAPKPAAPAAPAPESAVNGYYKVRSGDTAYSISRRFGLTVDQLKEMNGLKNSEIYPGQNLRVTP